ncbi:hypothetical protein [Streptomyces flavidovirens]|uniref:hypothetical protein n=1 Tax=Streptomyces flavidovirens TaxID=67298 RepID=UPI0036BD596F
MPWTASCTTSGLVPVLRPIAAARDVRASGATGNNQLRCGELRTQRSLRLTHQPFGVGLLRLVEIDDPHRAGRQTLGASSVAR